MLVSEAKRDRRLTENKVDWLVDARTPLRGEIALWGLGLAGQKRQAYHNPPWIPITVDKGQTICVDGVIPSSVHRLDVWNRRNGKVLSRRVCLLADLGGVFQRESGVSSATCAYSARRASWSDDATYLLEIMLGPCNGAGMK